MNPSQLSPLQELDVAGVKFRFASLRAAEQQSALFGLAQLPFSLRILAENLLRHADAPEVTADMLPALARGERGLEIPFWPARVLLQEHRIYPQAVRWFLEERIRLTPEGRAVLQEEGPPGSPLIAPVAA